MGSGTAGVNVSGAPNTVKSDIDGANVTLAIADCQAVLPTLNAPAALAKSAIPVCQWLARDFQLAHGEHLPVFVLIGAGNTNITVSGQNTSPFGEK